MTARRFSLRARISTDRPAAIRPVLERLFGGKSTTLTGSGTDFFVTAELVGSSARELNRSLLSELRRVEKKTRLRSQWTSEGITERFFDYVPKTLEPKARVEHPPFSHLVRGSRRLYSGSDMHPGMDREERRAKAREEAKRERSSKRIAKAPSSQTVDRSDGQGPETQRETARRVYRTGGKAKRRASTGLRGAEKPRKWREGRQ